MLPKPTEAHQDAAIPLIDLHLHQERSARLNQVLATSGLQDAIDWPAWAARLCKDTPPGIARLRELWASVPTSFEHDTPDMTLLRFRAILREAAAAGAVLVELRVGNETILRPGLFDLFREAERQVRATYPDFRATLLALIKLWHEPSEIEATLRVCLDAGPDGPSGVDLLYLPYESEADWSSAYRLVDRVAMAGLGVTAHCGEFSSSNIAAALLMPGLSRLGHAVHASSDERLLDQVLASGVAVECCLTSNVVLGAVPSLQEHPIRALRTAGVPIVFGTDNPLQLSTTIAREYELAASLGVSGEDLAAISREAISRSFLSSAAKTELLALPNLTVASG